MQKKRKRKSKVLALRSEWAGTDLHNRTYCRIMDQIELSVNIRFKEPVRSEKILKDLIVEFPDCAYVMSALAAFEKNCGNFENAEAYIKQAIVAAPVNYGFVLQLASFMSEHEQDVSRVDELFNQALLLEEDVSKKYPLVKNVSLHYAMFLEERLRDYDRAELHYKLALEETRGECHDQTYEYSRFLGKHRQDHEQVKAIYDKYSRHSFVLKTQYADYLINFKQSAVEAEQQYAEALTCSESAATFVPALVNYAGLLFSLGRTEEGKEYLVKAKEQFQYPQWWGNYSERNVYACMLFYWFAHLEYSLEHLDELQKLIVEGADSGDFSFRNNLSVISSHPDFAAIEKVASQLYGVRTG